jgi:hypothetical protein
MLKESYFEKVNLKIKIKISAIASRRLLTQEAKLSTTKSKNILFLFLSISASKRSFRQFYF